MIKNLNRNTGSALCKLFVLVISVMLLVACKQKAPQQEPPRPVFAMRVADTGEFAERTFPGRARAGKEVNQSFRVSGPLITFPVNVGDKVKKGDILARIDPQDFKMALGTLEGKLQRVQASSKRAQADLTRVENIRKKDPGAISQTAIDRALQVRDSAAADVRSLRSSVQNARDQLSYTYLKAPFDGIIVETYVENFETVVARQPILRLVDQTNIEFVISVPESLINLAPYVEKVTVTFDALPGVEIPATISEIGKEASQATRTYPLTLSMDQPDDAEILPGMAGEARVVARPPDDAKGVGIQIPATAIFTGDDVSKNFVWVVDEATKTLSRREVEIGQLARFGVLIKSGLNAGEWVVVKGVHRLEDGKTVRIMDTKKGTAP